MLAGLAVAGAEVAIVEDKGPEPGCRENLGILIEVILFHGRIAVSHHDCRNATASLIRQVQPTAQRHAVLGLELNVLAHGCLLQPQRECVTGRHKTRGLARYSQGSLFPGGAVLFTNSLSSWLKRGASSQNGA